MAACAATKVAIADDPLASPTQDELKNEEEGAIPAPAPDDDVKLPEPAKQKPEKVFNKPPKNPQAKLSQNRDKMISDSLKTCRPPVAKVSVPYFQKLKEGPVVYEVHASNSKCEWNVWHRFQTFTLLHEMLKDMVQENPGVIGEKRLPVFPTRHVKYLIDHKNKHFCESRRTLLDNYVKKIMEINGLRACTEMIGFLSHSDESLSKETVTKEEIAEYEKAKIDKIIVATKDDEVTSVTVKEARVVRHEYTLYQLNVTNVNKDPEFSNWTVMHRYSEFAEFDASLREAFPELAAKDIIPQLPMKEPKFVKDHFSVAFVEKRRLLLDSYIKRIARNTKLRRSPLTAKFCGVRD